ncbi:MAG: ABC transporter permease [Defluviitaleaceae bacterium]|nr:ABC transporter permease [Defluviitaleaceae bacterium]MCL2263548.1 ABC transporter permease [Defluviitaleaceae bacterium]
MTKKHFALAALILTAVQFVLFWDTLPIEVAGHRPGNIPMLVFYTGFVSATSSMLLVILLICVTKKTYVINQLKTFSKFRHLMFLMIKRDFVTRYRRSVLGILWSVLNPLLTMLVLTMVFSMLFRDMGIENFPVYLLSGQLMFNFFSEATNSAMVSITGGAGTIKKVYVPKYIFPISRVISALVNVGFSFLAFLFVFIVTGESFSWTMLLIPIPVFYMLLFSAGVGMFLSATNVFFRDISYIYGVLLTLVMFLTPIMYPVSILPDRVYHLIHLNPMYHFVSYFRALALNGVLPSLWSNIICLGFALAALGVGFYVKMSQQDKYILYL